MSDHHQSAFSGGGELETVAAPQVDLEYEPATGGYITRFDWNGYHSLVTLIVAATSEIIDRPPDEMAGLSSVVDPEAVNQLFEPVSQSHTRSDGRLTFPYQGVDITVVADGRIIILPRADRTGETQS